MACYLQSFGAESCGEAATGLSVEKLVGGYTLGGVVAHGTQTFRSDYDAGTP